MQTALIVIGVLVLFVVAVVVGRIMNVAARLTIKICPSCQARISGAAHDCHFCGVAVAKGAPTSKTVR